jgi:hypothetical protein
VRLTIAHRYDFRDGGDSIGRDLIQPGAWDAARDLPGPFGLPESRAEWERLARQPELERRAADVVAVLRRLGARSLCSYGVGTGGLEFNVNRLAPDVTLTCTDYAPRATERLQRLFVEAQVVVHDLAGDEPPRAELHLMHRIDTELDTPTWKRVFARISEPVLVVPTVLLDLSRMLKEFALRVLRPRATRAGWFRTEDAFRALWADSHTDEVVTIGEQRSFLLLPVAG